MKYMWKPMLTSFLTLSLVALLDAQEKKDSLKIETPKTKEFKIHKKLLLENTLSYIMSELEVQDIDNLEDWKIAELKYNLKQERLK